MSTSTSKGRYLAADQIDSIPYGPAVAALVSSMDASISLAAELIQGAEDQDQGSLFVGIVRSALITVMANFIAKAVKPEYFEQHVRENFEAVLEGTRQMHLIDQTESAQAPAAGLN